LSVSDTLSNFIHGVETEGAKVLAEIGGDAITWSPKVEAVVPAVEAKVETDWKALAVESAEFLKTVTKRFNGDSVYDHAQVFIAKVAAGL
jgi:hypothetical protein